MDFSTYKKMISKSFLISLPGVPQRDYHRLTLCLL